ncbi:MAG: galactose oxidase [Nitrospinae bacterium]|nr:galactose oxidase [Nitrospinota bacterium]
MCRLAATAVLMSYLIVLVGCGGGSDRRGITLPATDGSWVVRARMQEARQEVGVAALNGKVYVVGGLRRNGSQADTVEVYDIATDRWQFVHPLPLPLDHVAVAAARGKLYVTGGFQGAAAVDLTLEYDPVVDRWTPKAPMPTRRGAPAAAVIAEKVYAVGGFRDGASVSDLARYDPDADRWETLPPLPTPRDHLGAGAIKGRLYAVGGRNQTSFTLGSLEEFDPLTRTWVPRVRMPTPRSGVAAAVVNDRLYVFGGEGNARSPQEVFQEVEAFDPGADQWQPMPPMPTPRHGIGAAVQSTDILIPGGALTQGLGPTDVHEVFRVQTAKAEPARRFMSWAGLSLGRFAPTACIC